MLYIQSAYFYERSLVPSNLLITICMQSAVFTLRPAVVTSSFKGIIKHSCPFCREKVVTLEVLFANA